MINDIIFIDGFCVSVSSPYIRWAYNRVVGLTASLLRSWTFGIKYFIISLLCFLPPEYSILPVHITRLHEISWLLSLPVFFYLNSWLHSLPWPQVIHLEVHTLPVCSSLTSGVLHLQRHPFYISLYLLQYSLWDDCPLFSIKFSGFTGIKTPYKCGKDKFRKEFPGEEKEL